MNESLANKLPELTRVQTSFVHSSIRLYSVYRPFLPCILIIHSEYNIIVLILVVFYVGNKRYCINDFHAALGLGSLLGSGLELCGRAARIQWVEKYGGGG